MRIVPFYIASLLAVQDDPTSPEIVIGHIPAGVNATSREEAEQKAMEECLARLPVADGWMNHSAAVRLMGAEQVRVLPA